MTRKTELVRLVLLATIIPAFAEINADQEMCDQCFSVIKWYSDANPTKPADGWDYNLIADHLRWKCPKLVIDGWSVKKFCNQVQGKERAFGKAVRNYGWDRKKVCTVVHACSYFPKWG